MTTINTPTQPPTPVSVDFWWIPKGESISYTVGGKTYPYHHEEDEVSRPTDSRYDTWTTIINEPIHFDALDVKKEGVPRVNTPPGVSISEFRWDLGDGTIAYGPQVTHTYVMPDPNIFVTLIVTDSRGINWSSLKSLNLVSTASRGIVATYKIRV